MHLPAYFLEIAALIFALAGACFGWLTRWHLLLAAAGGSGLLFVVQCLLHMLDDETASLLALNGPAAFYAMICLWGMIPALIGAGTARLLKRWRNT